MKRYRSAKERKRIAAIVVPIVVILTTFFLVETIPWQGKKVLTNWFSYQPFEEGEAVVLQKDPNREFKVLTFTDIHFNDLFDIFGLREVRMLRSLDRLVEQAKPDLILVGGDSVWAPPYTRNSVRRFIKRMESYGIPWAPVFGNHDRQGNVDMNWIGDRFEEAEHCLFRKGYGNVDGVGNYIIHIKEGDRLVHAFYLFDSHARRTYENGKSDYDYLSRNQIDWYEWAVAGTEALAGEQIESTVLMHIPLIQFQMAYDAWKESGFDAEMGYGKNAEDVCNAPVDSGFFDSVLKMGSTKQIISGHDHINNTSILYEGVRLTYAMKTGNLGYCDETRIGGTLFTLGSDGHLSAPTYLAETGK